MGLFSASSSFSRYLARGEVSEKFIRDAVERVKGHLFNGSVAGLQEVAVGWTSIRDPYSPQLEYEQMVFGDYLVFSMMMETRRVPSALLKKHLALEERRLLEEKGWKRLGQKARKELRDKVRFSLLAKVIPVPSVYDVAWNLRSGTLLLFSCQDKVIQRFEELFFETFGIRPSPVTPYSLAQRYCEERGCSDQLSRAVPEVMI